MKLLRDKVYETEFMEHSKQQNRIVVAASHSPSAGRLGQHHQPSHFSGHSKTRMCHLGKESAV